MSIVRRLHEIDGIRGWAALIVLFYHLVWRVFGELHPAYRDPLLNFLLDGPLAVYVFFVLSGDALSAPFLLSGNPAHIDRIVLKRYFRLCIPILASALLVYGLMRLGLTYHAQAAPLVNSRWLGSFLAFEPTLSGALHFGLVGVFTGQEETQHYNPFLWPMAIELVGSFFVFAYLYLLPRLARPLATTVGAAALIFVPSPFYALFFAGIALGQVRRRGFFERLQASALGRWGMPLVILACVAGDAAVSLAIRQMKGAAAVSGAVVAATSAAASAAAPAVAAAPSLFRLLDAKGHIYAVFAVLIVFAVYGNAGMLGFFRTRFSRFLGDISFPLYILHFPVICSFTSWHILRQGPAMSMAASAAVILCSAVVSILLAAGFRPLEARLLRLVDAPVRRLFTDR